MNNRELIDNIRTIGKADFARLLSTFTDEDREYARVRARAVTDNRFGKNVFMRAIVEFSNFCKNDCLYCGIRCSKKGTVRYRMDENSILASCDAAYDAGFRTFVLQSGEDPKYTDEVIVSIVSKLHAKYPECAITLSIGEKSRETYQKFFDAGANRYLLRHETANKEHYGMLHPSVMSFDERMQCLVDLKEIGFQTGCGMMIGAPYQTFDHLAEDMIYIRDFQPQMVGTGPFIPAADTPFENEKSGSAELTLFILSLIRLMLPDVLLPGTTALGTVAGDGRLAALDAGANVIMLDLTPAELRKQYALYDGKVTLAEDTLEELRLFKDKLESRGYNFFVARGDFELKTV